MKKDLFKLLFSCCIVFFIMGTLTANAALQRVDPGSNGNGKPDVPIDGGISFLIIAGVGYGVY